MNLGTNSIFPVSQRTHYCFSVLYFVVYPCIVVQYSVQTDKVKASVDSSNSYFFIKGCMGEFLGRPEQDQDNPHKPLTYYPVYLHFYFCKRKLP